jgi:hypothetical protein
VSDVVRRAVRALLFVFVVLVLCPVRYWPVTLGLDDTWVFALNYAAAHGLSTGSDVVWTTGPLGYLVFPQDIGNNLAKALVFQFAIWALLIAIASDLFYRSGLSLRNLGAYSIFLSLAAPLFWFNHMGVENLLIAGVLILLVMNRLRGGMLRYVGALVLIGIIPLIKLTGGLIAGGALAGFLLDQFIRVRAKAWRELVLAAVIPTVTAAFVCWLTLPTMAALKAYLDASREIASGFSVAMSTWGRPVEFLMGAEVILLLCAILLLLTVENRKLGVFFALLLAGPMMISVKHGFVRQDAHLANFICFAALAMGLAALPVCWKQSSRLVVGLAIFAPFLMLWQDYVIPLADFRTLIAEVSGLRASSHAANALVRYGAVRRGLLAAAQAELADAPDLRLEPEVRTIVGDSPVASLSLRYSGAFVDGLNLRIYPVVQRYSAYTPYLDNLNAEWVRDRGPRFLLFDGGSIDMRDAWAETPAMWLEIYRWYDTRLLGRVNLLLERRAAPRFQRLESIGRSTILPADGLRLPASPAPVFWRVTCGLNTKGKLRKLAFRIAEVDAVENACSGPRAPRRVVMDVLSSPVMGNFLPGSLAEFAALFEDGTIPCPVSAIRFESGLGSYSDRCDVEFLQLAAH